MKLVCSGFGYFPICTDEFIRFLQQLDILQFGVTSKNGEGKMHACLLVFQASSPFPISELLFSRKLVSQLRVTHLNIHRYLNQRSVPI